MREWIIRGFLVLFLCIVVAVIWFCVVWLRPGIHYQRVHLGIIERTSPARLQLLARQAVTIADTLVPTNGLVFLRGSGDIPIPADFKDLDPTTIGILRDQVVVELGGGFDHYGFVVRRSEGDSNVWVIARYDESQEVQVGTYRHNGPATNLVVGNMGTF